MQREKRRRFRLVDLDDSIDPLPRIRPARKFSRGKSETFDPATLTKTVLRHEENAKERTQIATVVSPPRVANYVLYVAGMRFV